MRKEIFSSAFLASKGYDNGEKLTGCVSDTSESADGGE